MQKEFRPTTKPIRTRIVIPGTKRMTHRALLMAALANGTSEITGMMVDEDTTALISGLQQLGISVQLDKNTRSCSITGSDGQFPKKNCNIWCGNSALAKRFLLAACAISNGVYYFDCTAAERKNPINHMIAILQQQGSQFLPQDTCKLPLTIISSGHLEGGELFFSDSIHVHTISAALMIAPFARNPTHITIQEMDAEHNIAITTSMMRDFNIIVEDLETGKFIIPSFQSYQARHYDIEPDLHIAAHFFAAAAITGGQMTTQKIDRQACKQVSAGFLSALEKMGCTLSSKHDTLTLTCPSQLKGIDISMNSIEDTYLLLIALAPFADTPTRITDIKTHTLSKSRLVCMLSLLTSMGIKIEKNEDWIIIHPGTPQGGLIDVGNDHLIAMAFAVIGLRIPDVAISNTKSVDRIHPGFFHVWDKLPISASTPA